MTPKDYAVLAQAAYVQTPDIGVEATAARAIVRAEDDGIAVAFPGSNNLACWLADLDVETQAVTGMGVLHGGFWDAYRSIRPILMAESLPVVPVGHSEGAALALIYAADLCLAGRAPRAVFAFEPPHVSIDPTLAKLFAAHQVDVRIYRNGDDVVPLVPRILHPWQHPAEVIAIGKPSIDIPNVEDHMMDRVIAALTLA